MAKRAPTHVRIERARELIRQAETACTHQNNEAARANYHDALEQLEGMKHYDHIRRDVLVSLAFINLSLADPKSAVTQMQKALPLMDEAQQEEVFSAFEEMYESLYPVSPPEAPIPGKVIPFRRPSRSGGSPGSA